jgi:hypothetical protein
VALTCHLQVAQTSGAASATPTAALSGPIIKAPGSAGGYLPNRLFTNARDIAEFGLVSPDPVVRHVSRIRGTRIYDAAEVLVLAFRLATEAARASI